MTLDEQKSAVFEVALRIKRETSEWRAAELRAIYKAMMEYPAGPYDGGPTPDALWTIQARLVEDFEHVFFMQERMDQSGEVSALRANCDRVMKVIEETRDSAMLFMLQIKGLAITLKPTAPAQSAA
jgi:hypothetical protein